jgi:hypothetical protein
MPIRTRGEEAAMADTETKIGGVCGVLAAVAMIPAYVVGTPNQPTTPEEAAGYYASASWFVTANGALPLLHVLLGLVFLAVLVRTLRQAAGPSSAVYLALAGGTVFFALTSAGFAAEVAFPAAAVRFGVLLPVLAQPLLTLSVWSYHYAQIGAAAMIFATAGVVWRTRVLPTWVAGAGVLGILPLLHLWTPLIGALSGLLWFAVIGVALLVAPTPAPAERTATTATV